MNWVVALAGSIATVLTMVSTMLLLVWLKMRRTHRRGETLNIVNRHKIVQLRTQVDSKESPDESNHLGVPQGFPLQKSRSVEELNRVSLPLPPLVRLHDARGSTNSLDLDLDELDNNGCHAEEGAKNIHPKRCPQVEFNLVWASSSSTLTVYVTRITNLPAKYRKSGASTFYTVTFIGPKRSTARSSNLVSKSLNPEYSKVFSFSGVSLQEVQRSVLLFEVFVRRRGYMKDKPLGELRYRLCQEQLRPNTPVATVQPVTPTKKEGVASPVSEDLGGKRGEVLVVAQCQALASFSNRVKVVVRKAANLPPSKTLGGADYIAEVVVRRGGETVAVQSTKPATGPNPVWNAPFIFDVEYDKLSEYCVEAMVLRVGRFSRRSLGHALLGLDTTPKGAEHWERIMREVNRDVEMWYDLTLE
ncbi:synaptotagmin-4-like isoform X2 [Oratosquilla oratoria]|uniref:synaptotagmin-4-like isoform X2 n=1 Tax=Oratosquilla oratoria TaxID=337810 RepID=UPI003F768ACA